MIHFNLLEPSLSKKESSPRPNVEEHPIVERLEERTVMSVTIGVSVDGMNTTNNSCGCQPPTRSSLQAPTTLSRW